MGGKNHDLTVWDLETKAVTFRARNVPHDSLDMPVPIWITDIGWTTEGSIYTSTAYNQIRAYDLRQRRPVKDISLKTKQSEPNYHINCLKVTPENECVVGDVFGQVTLVDVMKTGRMIARFKGPKASIRSISIHNDSRSLACGGLDRTVRIFNLDSRKLIGKCYVKQVINSVTFDGIAQEYDNEEDEHNSEDIWGDEDDDSEEKSSNEVAEESDNEETNVHENNAIGATQKKKESSPVLESSKRQKKL